MANDVPISGLLYKHHLLQWAMWSRFQVYKAEMSQVEFTGIGEITKSHKRSRGCGGFNPIAQPFTWGIRFFSGSHRYQTSSGSPCYLWFLDIYVFLFFPSLSSITCFQVIPKYSKWLPQCYRLRHHTSLWGNLLSTLGQCQHIYQKSLSWFHRNIGGGWHIALTPLTF